MTVLLDKTGEGAEPVKTGAILMVLEVAVGEVRNQTRLEHLGMGDSSAVEAVVPAGRQT